MTLVLRAAAAFLALPGVIAFLIPLLVVRANDWPTPSVVGWPLLLAGTALLLWCVADFFAAGRGTLAPWDPPRQLVVRGPYRVSRNPMYVGVLLILAGWAATFRLSSLALYAMAVAVAFHLRVILNEEPFLARTHRDFPAYAARVPRWLFRTWRASLVAWTMLVVTLAAAGATWESLLFARAVRVYPPPGAIVEVRGHHLHLLCIGAGTPVVLVEASGFGLSSTSASRMRQGLAADTQVCSYDRVGMGWSDPAPSSTSVGWLADDLAALTDRAGLQPPFVVVASSIGGLTAELFARRCPDRTSALVMLDAANSGALKYVAPRQTTVTLATCGAAAGARVGLVRYLDPFHLDESRNDDAVRSAAFTYRPQSIDTLCSMARGMSDTISEFAAAPPLRADLPVVVLTAEYDRQIAMLGEPLLAHRMEIQQAFARSAPRGTWALIPASEHLLASDRPDDVIVAVGRLLRTLH